MWPYGPNQVERPDRLFFSRTDRTDRTDPIADRSDRTDRTDRSDRTDRTDWSGQLTADEQSSFVGMPCAGGAIILAGRAKDVLL